MDPHRYDTIFHAEHDLLCPLARSKVEAVIELLAVPADGHVLDAAAGKGELFARIVERYGCRGTAFEANPSFFQALRADVLGRLGEAADERVELLEAEAWEAEFETETFDLALCLGPPPFGDLETSLQRLWAIVKSGGQVLLGLWHWLDDEPDPDYMDAIGCGPDAYPTHERVFELARQEDFTPLYATTASRDELDHYEGMGLWATERWLRANPGDADAAAIRERLHVMRDAWTRWGRHDLGFGLYLLLK